MTWSDSLSFWSATGSSTTCSLTLKGGPWLFRNCEFHCRDCAEGMRDQRCILGQRLVPGRRLVTWKLKEIITFDSWEIIIVHLICRGRNNIEGEDFEILPVWYTNLMSRGLGLWFVDLSNSACPNPNRTDLFTCPMASTKWSSDSPKKSLARILDGFISCHVLVGEGELKSRRLFSLLPRVPISQTLFTVQGAAPVWTNS